MVTCAAVCDALKRLDINKSAGPDGLEPYFLKLAADCIDPPVFLTSL